MDRQKIARREMEMQRRREREKEEEGAGKEGGEGRRGRRGRGRKMHLLIQGMLDMSFLPDTGSTGPVTPRFGRMGLS
jgi:hypothetical protein